ncbi:TRAP transporter substrate-binding protein [uncultured Dysosmobacter sp.]|uniref:TRAP transporter substrate-binding protein n=1 Tax=uncultured Dysosmobacter sp. TaxID=2591384 RepID=UPI002620CE47|nr:TRAP transporter substrate-binding protein [uncultured Dysosmobacter sp.]
MSKKMTGLLLAIVMCVSLLTGCGGGKEDTPPASGDDSPAPAESVTLKLTHCQPEGSPVDLATEEFARLVEERTEGRVKIQLFPANMLGAESVTRDMVKEGGCDIVCLGSAANNYNNAMNLVTACYLFQNIEEADYMLFDSEFAQKYMHEDYLANDNVVYLTSWVQSPRQTMATKAFTTPAELKGIKLRVPAGIPVWEAAWNAMGALTVSMGLDDAFSALQQGACDGVEGPIDQLYFNSFQEVAKEMIMTQHNYYSYQMLMNNDSFSALSEGDQQIIRDTALELDAYHDQLRDENVDKLLEDLKSQGVHVTELSDEQLAAFAELCAPAIDANMDSWGQECYDEFMTELEAFRASH